MTQTTPVPHDRSHDREFQGDVGAWMLGNADPNGIRTSTRTFETESDIMQATEDGRPIGIRSRLVEVTVTTVMNPTGPVGIYDVQTHTQRRVIGSWLNLIETEK